ncbi:hypothetical protein [Bdellovibrio svalbardensis]|uniref:DUF5666 domain-containing protein n=1 Tax=Bdellovibrio svalbardensis TaxID=2972972 RepID=A0ABT6DFA7_9BACT|nr:hypothetical protein [Bdellovibrio svalbardensis]MDG0815527.1 hypothetical protein [Bdellovibrio svalbardensis]
MKALFSFITLMVMSASALAVTADTVAITGKIVSLEEKTLTLKVEDSKVQVSKKYLKNKHSVGEVVTVAIPKAEFDQLAVSKAKK